MRELAAIAVLALFVTVVCADTGKESLDVASGTGGLVVYVGSEHDLPCPALPCPADS